MKDLESRQSVLKEIMDLMEEREGNSLKKHPKVMAAKITIAKPEGKFAEVKKSDESAIDDLAGLDEDILEEILKLAEKRG